MFRIQITETRTVRKIKPKQWVVLSEKHGEKSSGYAPETETLVEEQVERLDQVVDTLDLVRVIKAVNGIEDWPSPGEVFHIPSKLK